MSTEVTPIMLIYHSDSSDDFRSCMGEMGTKGNRDKDAISFYDTTVVV